MFREHYWSSVGFQLFIGKQSILANHLPLAWKTHAQCFSQVGGVSLKQMKKFEYRWVAFTSDGRQDEKVDVRSGKATAVMRALHHHSS